MSTMFELPEPTRVDRTHPIATWELMGTPFTVHREGDQVAVDNSRGRVLTATVSHAAKLAAALSAAVAWTDKTVACTPDCETRCTCAPPATQTIDSGVLHGVAVLAEPAPELVDVDTATAVIREAGQARQWRRVRSAAAMVLRGPEVHP